jgi:hypothetical protein
MSDLRRDPAAIRAALEIDPRRRELYVEGPQDRQVLLWLLGDRARDDVVVQDISGVTIPVSQGGERGRLLAFAAAIAAEGRIRYFADADYDRLLNRTVPENGWLTDVRDLEGYALWTGCPEKAVRLGASRSMSDARSALRQSVAAARRVAYVRVADVLAGWQLPFQRFAARRRSRVRDGTLEFAEQAWIMTLVAECSPRPELEDVRAAIRQAEADHASTPDEQLVHGKDVVGFLTEFMAGFGVGRADAHRLLWSALERRIIRRYRNLGEVIQYLSAA